MLSNATCCRKWYFILDFIKKSKTSFRHKTIPVTTQKSSNKETASILNVPYLNGCSIGIKKRKKKNNHSRLWIILLQVVKY